MSIENKIRLAQLFDLYGALLSSGQRQAVKEWLDEDLTFSEIAENSGISRQAVKDAVTKAEKKLEFYEDKLKFLNRLKGEE